MLIFNHTIHNHHPLAIVETNAVHAVAIDGASRTSTTCTPTMWRAFS